MASVNLSGFSITVLEDNKYSFRIYFKLVRSEFETNLNVPCHIWLRLMMTTILDIDKIHLWADCEANTGDKAAIIQGKRLSYSINETIPLITSITSSDPGGRPPLASSVTSWIYAGLFQTEEEHEFTFEMLKSLLPASSREEEWYIVAAVRPDLLSGVSYSSRLALNI